MRRRVVALLSLAAMVAGGDACKRRDKAPVELPSDDAAPAETEAIEALAPPWRPPERLTAANDLLIHWLVEEGSPGLHVRLLLPLHHARGTSGGAAVVAEAMAIELRRRLQRVDAEVELVGRPDRVEVAIHGRDADLDVIFASLGRVVSASDPGPLLERGQAVVADGANPATHEHKILGALVGELTGAPAERLDADGVRALPAASLTRAWRDLVDPGRAVLVVHAGRPAVTAALERLAASWKRGLHLGGAETSALARIRPKDMSSGTSTPRRLRSPQGAPLRLLRADAARSGALYLGRVIPVADDRARGLARLAQRVLQEEFDARLTIVGDRALFVVRLPLPRGGGKAAPAAEGEGEAARREETEAIADPRVRRLARQLDDYLEFVRARHNRQRLAQAAELWLGGRMVQASVGGEDWTGLWSDSIDLSTRDGSISGALARDAGAMLGASPEELQAWSQRWLDFEKGEPGWSWVAATAETDLAAALRAITPVEALEVE